MRNKTGQEARAKRRKREQAGKACVKAAICALEAPCHEIGEKYIIFVAICLSSLGMAEIPAVFRLLENPCFL
ncbi:hypothetical protein J27TS7_42660 [Paenibacillus dendritiformis]|uniref:hypothetical protein n=1 Tax=Paenibacillus dendritiformis TaxID=130049 RepID=UPI001B2C8F5B|nr:hypothetical protein [Paenibacillus dendritiformis]GIO74752.1 hypothetical protein J27TS7_42660 [Paenibacillus dendritiformis]